MILFLRNIRTDKSIDKESRALVARAGIAKGHRVSSRGDENVLKLTTMMVPHL